MNTVTIWSESGGVGKTTTTINLAAALDRNGYDTLIVDLDPQPASVTDYAGYPEAKRAEGATITDALLDRDGVTFDDIILSDENYDVVPAHESLASLESTVRAEQISGAEFLLRASLDDLEQAYDFVLLDPPATLNILVDNALIASGNVLVPMEMTRKGARSVDGVQETISALETQLQRVQPDFTLQMLGVVPNKVDNSTLNQNIETELQDKDVPVLPVTIPDYNVLEKSWEANLDIFQYQDEHGLQPYQESLLDAYQSLADIIAGESRLSDVSGEETAVSTQ